MANNPSTDNYVLGKGHLTFDQYDDQGALTGELSLGNAPAFTFSLSIEKLDHYSSLGGLKAKDKSVITEVAPTCTFTLDELSGDNINKLFMGTSAVTSQVATVDGTAYSTSISNAVAGQFYQLDHKAVRILRAAYSETTGTLALDEVVTDTTSTTTARAIRLETIAGVKYAWLVEVNGSGGWTANGAITSTGLTAGNWVGTPEYIDAVVIDDGTSEYLPGTDFTVNTELGMIQIGENTSMTLTSLTVKYDLNLASFTTISGLDTTAIEGQLRYTSDNPEGTQMMITMWKVSLTPDGDTAFIGDDWATLSFTGEILKDEAGHPANPYVEVVVKG